MRIGLDTSQINLQDGSARYTQEMVRNLCSVFPGDEFFAFGPSPQEQFEFDNLTWVKIPAAVGLVERARFCIGIGRELEKYSLDVFHNLCNYGFLGKPCPVVTTIHDLTSLKYGHVRSRRVDQVIYKYIIPRLLRNADWIVADSFNSAEDLRTHYEITDRVTTVYLGYDKLRFNLDAANDTEVLERHQLRPGYVLFAGYLTPKKNLEVVADALSRISVSAQDVPLVIAGARGPGAEDFYERVRALGIEDSVRELGFVPNEDLGALYRQARVFVLPSVYEGFGLPTIESMACGTPPLVSGVSSLAELVTRPELSCDPNDAEEWSTKLERIITDEDHYEELRTWSLDRSKDFSWENCVRRVMNVYQQVQ